MDNTKSFLYPPGGILIWILVIVELLTFGLAIIFMFTSAKSPDFISSPVKPNVYLGTLNTFILLTSGFFVAEGVNFAKLKDVENTRKYLKMAMILGSVFIIIKLLEYYLKIREGIGPAADTFYTFYFMLTGFHLIHVLVGVILLSIMFFITSKKIVIEDIEASAIFWHMCDLIWLIIFPSLYLIL